MISLATALPENSNDGYVAAAYIVFLALLLVYVAIMAVRLARVERSVRTLTGTGELREDRRDDAPPEEDFTGGPSRDDGAPRARTHAGGGLE
jgi:hypothetical protein